MYLKLIEQNVFPLFELNMLTAIELTIINDKLLQHNKIFVDKSVNLAYDEVNDYLQRSEENIRFIDNLIKRKRGNNETK